MAIWSISPHDDVVPPYENSDGKFKFLPTATPGKAYTISYQNGNKIKSITYTIPNPYPCSLCDCEDIIFTPIDNREFGVNEQPNTVFGTISYKDGSGCDGKVNLYHNDGITNLRIEGNKVIGDISEYIQYEELKTNARILKIWFGVNGTECDEVFEFYQQAFRGTDNGVDSFADGTEKSYPIFIVGYYNPDHNDNYCRYHHAYGYCETFDIHGSYHSTDSIVSEGGAWIYVDGTAHKLNSETFEQDFPNGLFFGDGNWLKVDMNPTDDGYCFVGSMRVSATTEWDGNLNGEYVNITLGEAIESGIVRTTRFMLGTNPNFGPTTIMEPDPDSIDGGDVAPGKCRCYVEGCPSPEHQGKQCAKTWFYDVMQLPKGHYICFHEDGNYKNYRLLPLSVPCDKDRTEGDCECNNN